MGRHASPGYGRFTRELTSFAVRLFLVAVVFFGAIWVLVTVVPDWLGNGGDEDTALATDQTTSTTEESVSSVLDSVITPPTVGTATTTSTAPETTTTVPPERLPADVVVLVLNSTNRSGLAASATAVLADLGYQTLEPGNATPVLSDSEIHYSSGFALEAFTVAAQFPDAVVAPDPETDLAADIVVILGTSYVP